MSEDFSENYVLKFGTKCCQCKRELRMSYLLSEPSVAHVVHMGWGPICRRCCYKIYQNSPIGWQDRYSEYNGNDDAEVYEE